MKCLIRERLSEHKYKTPEGYLICVDSILARTGKQTYRRSELFQDGDDSEVDVDRPENEVFSPATLASFENKPIVVEHPDEDVNANNIKQYAVGFVRDVKRGKTADGQDVMLGTLVIQDAETIEEIENGEHTDLSCGYDCDIADEANPTQRNIRGNHVALCAQGRAGIAKIVDSVKTLDFDAQLQENKLSKTSIEYRKKLNEQPNNKKALLLEAENIIEQIVDDTDEKNKATIRKYADKHLADIRAFAASLKDSITDAISEEYKMWVEKINGAARTNDEDLLKVYIGIIKNDKHLSWVEEDELIKRIKRFLPIKSAVDDNIQEDSIKDGKDLNDFKRILQQLSKMYSNDPDILFVMKTLNNFGWKTSLEKIEGWTANRNVPGEYIKKYTLVSDVEGKQHHVLVTLYADDKDWRVKEINAYTLDSVKDARSRAQIEADIAEVERKIDYAEDHNDVWTANRLYDELAKLQKELEGVHDSMKDSRIKDAKYAIWVKEKGQWKPWGSTDRDMSTDALKEQFKQYEDVALMPNDGSKPKDCDMKDSVNIWRVEWVGKDGNYYKDEVAANSKNEAANKVKQMAGKDMDHVFNVMLYEVKDSSTNDSVNDGSPVDVLNVVQSKRDNTGKTWYLLEISMRSGTRAYIVTADYKGEKTYTGGGAVSFSLGAAKSDLDAFITINNLNSKYGQAEGYKRYMAGQKDSIKDAKYLVTAYANGKLLEEKLVNNLTEAQKLANEFEKRHGEFSTTIQFVYDSSTKDAYNKYANETDKQFLKEALSEMRRYERNWSGMSSKERQNISPEGINALRQDIKFAEQRLKQLGDSSTFEEVTESLKKNEPKVDDIVKVVNAVKAVKRTKDAR